MKYMACFPFLWNGALYEHDFVMRLIKIYIIDMVNSCTHYKWYNALLIFCNLHIIEIGKWRVTAIYYWIVPGKILYYWFVPGNILQYWFVTGNILYYWFIPGKILY
uniref:Uncharacterized protein n=1 Tax=Capsaspora owczarzaki TaxID=192875 RepID=M1JEP2_9EUKA|nr:hypothetical protein [Capsaspora owczarzaki]